MEWRYLGKLNEARNSGCSGVYLIVHEGRYKRIVYVGVSVNIGRRIAEHYEGYLRGNRSIYDAGSDIDVYKYMSSYKVCNHIQHYKSLAAHYKIWASTTINAENPTNLLDPKQEFSFQWQDIALNTYIPQLAVWALPMPNYSYQAAILIESVIQKKIITTFDLRGFFNLKSISILGKIEHPNISKIKTVIDPPDLDEATNIVFQGLDKKKIPKHALEIAAFQLSEEIEERDRIKQRKKAEIEAIQAQYPKHGKKWSREDMEKLRIMAEDFSMSPKEMSRYLERKPRSIATQIERNDKLSRRMWRKNLKWL